MLAMIYFKHVKYIFCLEKACSNIKKLYKWKRFLLGRGHNVWQLNKYCCEKQLIEFKMSLIDLKSFYTLLIIF